MKLSKRLALALTGLSAATVLIGSGVAHADPTLGGGENGYDRPLQGTGSDTTEEVMNGLADTIKVGGNKVLASWNALGGAFQTRSTDCTFTSNIGNTTQAQGKRPNGSGQGRQALIWAKDGSTNPNTGCLDFARSSSVGGATSNNLTYIPFAKDAVAFAVSATSNLPRKLTFAELKAMYKCQYPGFTGANPTYHALIPQSGSGTRSFWLTQMGLTESAIQDRTTYACVADQTDRTTLSASGTGANPIQEHRGNVLDNNTIVPISIGQYIAQSQGAATDYRGSSVLGTIVDDDTLSLADQSVSYPMSLNTTYGTVSNSNTALNATLTRDVYNVVWTADLTTGSPDSRQTLVKQVFADTDPSAGTNTSLLCAQSSTIQKYGFGVIANCGDTSLVK